MKVVIPLAGKGTRLRPHTYVTPKPLLRVGGRPVMSYILDQLVALDVSEIIFITGYLKEKIEAYVAAEYPTVATRFIEQRVQDGTAGAVQLAAAHIDQDVLIVFVDTLFDADLSLVRRLPPEAAGIIWVKEVVDYRRFGVVLTDDDGYMQRIVEKPREPVSRLANIGLYHVRDWKLLFHGVEHVLSSPPGPGGEFYLTDAFQFMIDRGARILTAPVAGWYDCGKPETLLETNAHLLEIGRSRVPPAAAGVLTRGAVRVEDGTTLHEVEIGPHVSIGAGARITASRISNSIIGNDAVIEHADLHDSLIGDRAVVRSASGRLNIGADARVEGG